MKSILFFILILSHLAAFGGGAWLYWKTSKPQTVEKIVIREVEKPVYKYIKEVKADNTAELFKAYKSPIKLSYTTFDSKIKVVASDDYKSTTALWEISETPNYKLYFGVAGVSVALGGFLAYKIFK